MHMHEATKSTSYILTWEYESLKQHNLSMNERKKVWAASSIFSTNSQHKPLGWHLEFKFEKKPTFCVQNHNLCDKKHKHNCQKQPQNPRKAIKWHKKMQKWGMNESKLTSPIKIDKGFNLYLDSDSPCCFPSKFAKAKITEASLCCVWDRKES